MDNEDLLIEEPKRITPKCKRCRDIGLKGGCPKCGKVSSDLPVTVLQEKSGIVTDDTVMAVIPEYYRGRVWDKNELTMSHKELEDNRQFNIYVEQLDKIQKIFMSGNIPNQSVILIAPRQMSKQIWANSCIQFGMKCGHKMLPVMSSNLVKVAMANMFERSSAGILRQLGYTIEDLMTADCLFINIDSGWQKGNAYSLIDEITCMRSNFDRPTIFISRFSIDELTKSDYNKTFNKAILPGKDINRLRYPAIIQCTQEG